MSANVPSPILPPPITVPLPPDVWLSRRYGLPAATAKLIGELAFAPAASWCGASR